MQYFYFNKISNLKHFRENNRINPKSNKIINYILLKYKINALLNLLLLLAYLASASFRIALI